MNPTSGRRALALLLAAPVLAGCGGATAETAASPQPSLSARADQTRPDAAAGGRFQVVVVNTGTMPFTVTSVQLVSEGFTTQAAVPKDTDFAPGRRVSLPAPYGRARCDRSAEPADVALGLVVDGQERRTRFPLRSDNGLLERIHAKECASRALAELVELTLDEPLVAVDVGGEPGLRTTLTVRRRTAEGPVELTGTRGSVLYDVTLPQGPAHLPSDEQAVSAPLVLTSRTCSGHAVGEAKKPYSFLAFLRVGTAAEASAAIPVTPAQQARLLDFLDEACVQLTTHSVTPAERDGRHTGSGRGSAGEHRGPGANP